MSNADGFVAPKAGWYSFEHTLPLATDGPVAAAWIPGPYRADVVDAVLGSPVPASIVIAFDTTPCGESQ